MLFKLKIVQGNIYGSIIAALVPLALPSRIAATSMNKTCIFFYGYHKLG